MIAFVEENRTIFGVEPICRVLPIAPSTFYAHLSVMRDPERASNRAKHDTGHCKDIERIWKDNRQVYGARKVWHVLQREGKDIARCTVERLMKVMGLQGAVRGKKVITTNPDAARPCPDDRVNRQFKAIAPNRLWVFRLYLCLQLDRDGLRRFRYRRLRPQDCRLEGFDVYDHRFRTPCTEPGDLSAMPS